MIAGFVAAEVPRAEATRLFVGVRDFCNGTTLYPFSAEAATLVGWRRGKRAAGVLPALTLHTLRVLIC